MKRFVHQLLALPVFLSAVYVGQSSADETAAPPRALSIGTQGAVQPSANVHAWFTAQKKESETLNNQFRIRRTELKLKGDLISKKLSFDVMIDPAQVLEKETTQDVKFKGKVTDADGNQKDADLTIVGKDKESNEAKATGTVSVPKRFSVLQDAAITCKHDWTEFSIGQFKIPVSFEGYNSSSKLILPERALVSKGLGDKRDIGIRFAKTFEMFGYTLGVYNGSGQNTKDENDDKDIGLRLEAYPVKGLTIAGVGYSSLGADKEKKGKKQRYEVDLRYESYSFLYLAEFIMGTDQKGDDDSTKNAPRGFYGLVGYTIGGFQPVIRVGQFDANTNSKTSKKSDGSEFKDDSTHIEGGVNYYIPGLKTHEGKVQLAVSQFSGGASPEAGKDGSKELQVITAFQVAF